MSDFTIEAEDVGPSLKAFKAKDVDKTPKAEAPPPGPPKNDKVDPPASAPLRAQKDATEPPVTTPEAPEDDELTVFAFESSVELACTYDPDFNAGAHLPHPWQIEISEFLCKREVPNRQDPLMMAVRACNSSGKDAYVVAPFAVWFACTKKLARIVITTSSAQQLEQQTEKYIANLCKRINRVHGKEIFRVVKRHIKCNISGSEIFLFATDEAGKAEGFHPFTASSEQLIIVNECKSVKPEIFEALLTCEGYNYWLEVSTPGAAVGHFYEACTRWQHTRHITAYECPHIGQQYIENAKLMLGEGSPRFKSMIDAEFTNLDDNVLIQAGWVTKAWKSPPVWVGEDWPIRVGIDWSGGGDELTINAFQGNRQIYHKEILETDTYLACKQVNDCLEHDLKLSKDHPYIFADDGGIGKALTDLLRGGYGWEKIRRVLNQSAAQNTKYTDAGNRGFELWYKVARMFEDSLLWLMDDNNGKLHTQLANRHYERRGAGKFYLMKKEDERSEGRPSPDRADSLVLAFTDVALRELQEAVMQAYARSTQRPMSKDRFLAGLFEKLDNVKYNQDKLFKQNVKPQRIGGSLQRAQQLSELYGRTST